MKAVIDCKTIQTRSDLHDALQQVLPLPSWYGRNLDALADCLGDLMEETDLVFLDFAQLKDTLGFYAHTLEIVLRRAGEDNPRLHITYAEA